jgi:hypothetical protein
MEAVLIYDCDRCSLPCRVGGPKNPEARFLRRSATGQGYCPSCATTQFLKTTTGLSELLKLRGPEVLRDPVIQRQFVAVMAIGGADATPDEIDWERVIANWALPVAGETPR